MAGGATRGYWRRRGWIGCLAVLLTLAGGATGSRASGGLYPALGAAWITPADSGLREIYDPGLGFTAAVGYLWRDRLRAEARLDWFRAKGLPVAPPFVRDPTSRLTLAPLSLIVQYDLGRSSSRPFVSAGGTVWIESERFDYDVAGSRGSQSGTRSEIGLQAGAGVEFRRGFATWRLGARGIFGPRSRQVLRPRGDPLEIDSGSPPSFWTVGLELLLR